MIKFAQDCYHSQIKSLWKSAFGDTDEFLDFYFSNRHKNENMLICLKEETVVAMLSMLPLDIKADNKIFAGRYIYAVATQESYRGLGISTRLIEYVHNWMKENNEQVSILVPASKSLFEFYKNRGFKTAFKIDSLDINSDEIQKYSGEINYIPCDLEKFTNIRNTVFDSSALFAKWRKQDLEYFIKFAKFSGEELYYFYNNIGEGYVVYERMGKTIIIKEIALINLELETVLSALHNILKAKIYKIRLPEQNGGTKALTRDFGMVRWLVDEPKLTGNPPYLALVLD